MAKIQMAADMAVTRRRGVLGGGSLLLLTAAAAGATKAAELDSELLAACKEFLLAEAEFRGWRGPDDIPDALGDRRYDALGVVWAIPARTPEGMAAKAKVARTALAGVMEGENLSPATHDEEFFAIAVLEEICGRAEA